MFPRERHRGRRNIDLVAFPGAEDELGFMIIAGTVWGALIGTSFSTILAIAARGRSLDELSYPRVASVGAAGGLLLAAIIVGSTLGDWPNGGAIVPFSILPLLGAGGGMASLRVARRAERSKIAAPRACRSSARPSDAPTVGGRPRTMRSGTTTATVPGARAPGSAGSHVEGGAVAAPHVPAGTSRPPPAYRPRSKNTVSASPRNSPHVSSPASSARATGRWS